LGLDVPRVLPGAGLVEIAERELGQGRVVEDDHRLGEGVAVRKRTLTDDEAPLLARRAELYHDRGERHGTRGRKRRGLRDELEARFAPAEEKHRGRRIAAGPVV